MHLSSNARAYNPTVFSYTPTSVSQRLLTSADKGARDKLRTRELRNYPRTANRNNFASLLEVEVDRISLFNSVRWKERYDRFRFVSRHQIPPLMLVLNSPPRTHVSSLCRYERSSEEYIYIFVYSLFAFSH